MIILIISNNINIFFQKSCQKYFSLKQSVYKQKYSIENVSDIEYDLNYIYIKFLTPFLKLYVAQDYVDKLKYENRQYIYNIFIREIRKEVKEMNTIKISFKGKITLLPRGVDSIQKIQNEMINRYKNQFKNGIILKYQQKIISSFQQIVNTLKRNGAKNIKLQAQPAPQKIYYITDQKKQSNLKSSIQQVDSMNDNFCSKLNLQKQLEQLRRYQTKELPKEQTHQIQLSQHIETEDFIVQDQKIQEKPEKDDKLDQPEKDDKLDQPEKDDKLDQPQSTQLKSIQVKIEKQKEQQMPAIENKQLQKKNEQNQQKFDGQISISSQEDIEILPKANEQLQTLQQKEPIKQQVHEQIFFTLQSKQQLIQNAIEDQQIFNKSIPSNQFNHQLAKQFQNSGKLQESSNFCNSKNFYCNYQSEYFPKQNKETTEQFDCDLKEVGQGVYECLFCKKPQNSCNICKGKKTLDKASPIIKLITKVVDSMVDKRVAEKLDHLQKIMIQKQKCIMQQLNRIIQQQRIGEKRKIKIINKLKKQQQEQQFQQFKNSPNNFQINDDKSCVKNVKLGDQISWVFNVKVNRSTKQKDLKIVVVDEQDRQVIKSMPFQNQLDLEVGPFHVVQPYDEFIRKFNLHIKKGQKSICSQTFGFSVPILKPKTTKLVSNKLRDEVAKLRKSANKTKSIDYYMNLLKEYGITQTTYDENLNELISDIVRGKQDQ